jgi:peptidoglycan/LPS O-acetylase OafA/YrhL
MPLYYAVLVVVLVVVPAVLGLQHLPPLFQRLLSNQIWLWTYLQNYIQSTGAHALPGLGHFWSLAVEEQFYWFWPLLVYLLSRRYLFNLCVAVCVFEPLLRLAMLHFGVTPWAIRQYTYTRADTLLYGALAALIIRSPNCALWLRKNIFIPATLCAAALGAITLKNGFIPYEAVETIVVGYSALGFLFAVCIYKAASETNPLSKLLSATPLRWFGKYSYAIYIFHWPVAQAYEAIVAPRLPFLARPVSALFCFLVVTSVSSGIAVLSWFLFESRFLALKRYFEHAPRGLSSRKEPGLAPLAA